ncbi:MAG TPA: phosphate ABC transporter ATP-binding protein [Bacillota bacterium]|nr:phosphate ABC transporter ATP-binding protein [Bacillota bacterium]
MSVDESGAIRFDHVDYSTDGTHILKDITGYFPNGKITTLIGPSGAGKTTLFRLCNGLVSPDAGNIYVQGKAIDRYDPVVLRRTVGLALQQAPMIRGTVKKNLALPLTLQGETMSDEQAKELLNMVGLDEQFLYRDSKGLSGGQQQKLSIARTLVNQPAILLLDEITSSLDQVSQHDIETLIKQINQTYETTIVWITHNLQQAIDIGDYAWVLIDGKVAESGESSLLHHPENRSVQQFVKGEIE